MPGPSFVRGGALLAAGKEPRRANQKKQKRSRFETALCENEPSVLSAGETLLALRDVARVTGGLGGRGCTHVHHVCTACAIGSLVGFPTVRRNCTRVHFLFLRSLTLPLEKNSAHVCNFDSPLGIQLVSRLHTLCTRGTRVQQSPAALPPANSAGVLDAGLAQLVLSSGFFVAPRGWSLASAAFLA